MRIPQPLRSHQQQDCDAVLMSSVWDTFMSTEYFLRFRAPGEAKLDLSPWQMRIVSFADPFKVRWHRLHGPWPVALLPSPPVPQTPHLLYHWSAKIILCPTFSYIVKIYTPVPAADLSDRISFTPLYLVLAHTVPNSWILSFHDGFVRASDGCPPKDGAARRRCLRQDFGLERVHKRVFPNSIVRYTLFSYGYTLCDIDFATPTQWADCFWSVLAPS